MIKNKAPTKTGATNEIIIMNSIDFIKKSGKVKFRSPSEFVSIQVYDLIEIIDAYANLGTIPFLFGQLIYDKEDKECFKLDSASDVNLINKSPYRFRNPTDAERQNFVKTT